jgi:hypothetical protein
MESSSNISVKSFWWSLAVFLGVCIAYFFLSASKTDGHFTYIIDDAYIHLAVAKNFALHDVWGITRYQFSSTSSSPLFTYLLSVLIKIFGDSDQLPLYFNAVFGIGTVFILSKFFSRIFNDVKNVVIAVLFTLFFAVLHLQVLAGMEHIFHVFLLSLNILCLSNLKNKLTVFGFYLSLFIMGLVRFESMFYFVILAFVFILIKKWKEAVMTLLVGFLPIIIFCYFNYQEDGYLFPNSIVVKGTKLSFDSTFIHQLKVIIFDNFLLNISFYKLGFFPILMCLILILKDFKKKSFHELIKNNFLLIVISLLMICQSMFADLKGGFRYEAYILTGFSMALIPKVKGLFENFKVYIKKEKLLSFLILMNLFLLGYKTFYAHFVILNGGKNIYEQQVQSAKFLHTYYNDSKIVANDIGAVAYYTDIHLLDIAGLGSKETIRFNENKKQFDKNFENFLTHYCTDNNYQVAIVYEIWLQGFVPKNWKKAGVLKIKNPITVARDEVTIYSIDNRNLPQLKENIRKFNWNKNVQVTIID